MKFSSGSAILTTFAAGLSLVQAGNLAQITFIGAGGAQFSQDFPTDGSVVQICQLTSHDALLYDS